MLAIERLDGRILTLASVSKFDAAIRAGLTLIALYDKYQMSSTLYKRTYYDLFQVSIPCERTYKQGVKYIKLAVKYAEEFAEREAEYQDFVRYARNPTSHRNYGASPF